MGPKPQPKTLSLTIKSHTLSIILTAPQTLSITALKQEIFSALTSHPDHLTGVIPRVKSTKDFELSRSVKEKGRPTGEYEVLDPSEKVKDSLVNWETVYLQFRDGSGDLLPVEVKLPDLVDEDEDPVETPQQATSEVAAGKRKAREE